MVGRLRKALNFSQHAGLIPDGARAGYSLES